MSPTELEKKEVKFTNGGCTIYSLIGAIYVLQPDMDKGDVNEKINELINIPLNESTLYEVAKENELPPVLFLDSGGTRVMDWINAGKGDILSEYINTKLYELGFKIAVSFEETNRDNRYEQYMDILNSGKAIIAPCTINMKNNFKANHHIALVGIQDEIQLMDPNREWGMADINVLRDMLRDKREIGYGQDSICFNNDPLIVVERL